MQGDLLSLYATARKGNDGGILRYTTNRQSRIWGEQLEIHQSRCRRLHRRVVGWLLCRIHPGHAPQVRMTANNATPTLVHVQKRDRARILAAVSGVGDSLNLGMIEAVVKAKVELDGLSHQKDGDRLFLLGELGWALTTDGRDGPLRSLTDGKYRDIDAIRDRFNSGGTEWAVVEFVQGPEMRLDPGRFALTTETSKAIWDAYYRHEPDRRLRAAPFAAVLSGHAPATEADIRRGTLKSPIWILLVFLCFVTAKFLMHNGWPILFFGVIAIISLPVVYRANKRRSGISFEVVESNLAKARGADARLYDCTYVGGHGADLVKGSRYVLDFHSGALHVRSSMEAPEPHAIVPQIITMSIGGAGEYTTGGGFIGGGFGVTGALQGIAMAEILNSITSKTHIETVLAIRSRDAELFFVHDRATPQQMRIDLSAAISRLPHDASMSSPSNFVATAFDGNAENVGSGESKVGERTSTNAVIERLAQAAELRRSGDITQEEFSALKQRLLGEAQS